MAQSQEKLDRMVQFAASEKQEMEKLNNLIGLEEFKKAMRRVVAAQKRQIIACSRGRDIRAASFHMCFLGNPGTGKTEMSRYAAKLLYKSGAVGTDKFLIADRSHLVGEHVGETAIKTKALLKKASGGVLLIDEAYALMEDREGSYGDEAINTLVEEMENCRGDLVIIFAGYPDRMKKLLSSNPGLQSRIPYTVHFQDYTVDQLFAIAEKFAADDGFYFRGDVREKLNSIFSVAMKAPEFGNARYVRNLIEQAETDKIGRIDIMELKNLTDDEIFQLTADDFLPLADVSQYVPERRIGF